MSDRTFWGLTGSGILFQRASDGKVLLLRRRGTMNSGTWGIPGGKVDEGEAPRESAEREAEEEVCEEGSLPEGRFTGRSHTFSTPLDETDYLSGEEYERYAEDGEVFRYITYLYLVVDDEWEPVLNWEHDRWDWFDPKSPPSSTLSLRDENGKTVYPVKEMLAKLPSRVRAGRKTVTLESFVNL